MKVKLATFVTLIIALLTLASSSRADCRNPCQGVFYVAGSGAITWHNDIKSSSGIIREDLEYKTGWGAAASAGGIFDMEGCWDVRLELEYVYRRNKLRNVTLSIDDVGLTFPISGHNQDHALMGNFIVDVAICCGFSIYYGIGFGVSWNTIKINFDDINSTNRDELFAWQVLAGLSYSVSSWLELTLGYRLFGTTIAGRFNNFDFRPHHHPITNNLEFGARVPF